jgi:hypothetical protein
VHYLDPSPPIQWRICDATKQGLELVSRSPAIVQDIEAITTRLDSPEYCWLRGPITAISSDLNPETIFDHVRKALGSEEVKQEIEWSEGPPSGKPINADTWYGSVVDPAWRVKACHY